MKQQKRKVREDVRNLPLKVKAEMALKEAVAEALAEHKRQGYPIAVWLNPLYQKRKGTCVHN